MNLDLILIRHGAAEHTPHHRYAGSGTDSDLIGEGEEEARAVANALSGIGAEAIWSGPLLRQRKTAGIIAEALGVPHRETSSLNELDFGEWEGHTKEEIADRHPEELRAWNEESVWPTERFVGTEKERMDAFDAWLDEVRGSGAPIVAVTSNGLLRLLGKRFLGHAKGPYGVWTGHGCRLLMGDGVEVSRWNAHPQDIA